MKPLSVFNFIKRNIKSFITSVVAIALSVVLVYGIDCIIASTGKSAYDSQLNILKKSSLVCSLDGKLEDVEKSIKKLKESNYFDYFMPVNISNIRYSTVGNSTNLRIYGLLKEDMNYFIDKYKIEVNEGRLPEDGTNEYALDSKVAKNNKLKLGDKYSEGKIVGILESDSFISLTSYSSTRKDEDLLKANPKEKLLNYGVLVFPKEESFKSADNLVSSLDSKSVYYSVLSKEEEDLIESSKSSQQIFNAISILIIIVMVVTLSSVKYAHFINRRGELGILNAIGYGRTEIMKMMLIEVLLFNMTGFIVGILFGVGTAYILTNRAFTDSGAIAVYLSMKGFTLSLLAPLLTSIFSLIPIYRNIGKSDAISVIQEG